MGQPVGGDPDKLAHSILYDDLWPRWGRLQDELEVLSVSEAREDVRREIDALIRGCRGILTDVQYFIIVRKREPLSDEERASVVNTFDEASEHAHALVRLLRDRAGGPPDLAAIAAVMRRHGLTPAP